MGIGSARRRMPRSHGSSRATSSAAATVPGAACASSSSSLLLSSRARRGGRVVARASKESAGAAAGAKIAGVSVGGARPRSNLTGLLREELWTPSGTYRPLQTGRSGRPSVLRDLGTAARLDDSFPGPDVGGDDKASGIVLPTQGDVLAGEGGGGTQVIEEYKPISDIEYLQELLAIQDNGPKAVGIFGTRNCGILHQQLIEVLAYAIGITVKKDPHAPLLSTHTPPHICDCFAGVRH